MQCPQCDSELKNTERQGVEITFCPGCKGLWLDSDGISKVLQSYMSERLRMMRRYEEYFATDAPEIEQRPEPPAEFESIEERRRYEMRSLEEIQFGPNWPQKPRERGGMLYDIFDVFDEPTKE